MDVDLQNFKNKIEKEHIVVERNYKNGLVLD